MADAIQATLEGMATELNLLVRAGVLRRSEVRAVVRKRTRFEYRTRRMRAEKLDFVRYLQFERRLEHLRQRRIAQLARPVNPMLRHGGVQHIRRVYERALLRFPGDLRLWLSYIAFAQRCFGPRATSSVIARALRLHPRHAPLWTLAARWEIDANANLRNARALLQRAIAINPHIRDLYLDYVRLELLIQERIMAVSDSLPVAPGDVNDFGDATSTTIKKEKEDDNDDDDDDDEHEEKEEEEAEKEEAEKEEEEEEEAPTAFERAGVARVIVEEAIAKMPLDLELRSGLLGVFAAFESVDGVAELARDIARGIETDFAKDADAWAAVAEWEASRASSNGRGSSLDAAEAVWKRAVAALPDSTAVWERRAAFVAVKAAMDVDSTLDSASAPRVAAVCAEADAAGQASTRLYELWLSCAAATDNVQLAVDIAKRATRRWPDCPTLWRARIALLEAQKGDTDAIMTIKMAISGMHDAGSAQPLWIDLVERLCKSHAPFKTHVLATMADAFIKLCAPLASPKAHNAAPVIATAALRSLLANINDKTSAVVYTVDNVRALITLALRYSACRESTEFCHAAAEFEIAEAHKRPVHDLAHVRELFRHVLLSSGSKLGQHDHTLWLLWHRAEQDAGNMSAAANVYHTARSTLADCSLFLQSFA